MYADICVNRLGPCLHKSVLTCSAHSGRGLSTQMISFLQSERKGKNRQQRKEMWSKKKDKNEKEAAKMDEILKLFFCKIK